MAAYFQPCGLAASNVVDMKRKSPAEGAQTGDFDIWLPIVDAYRTICIAPTPAIRAVFESLRDLDAVA